MGSIGIGQTGLNMEKIGPTRVPHQPGHTIDNDDDGGHQNRSQTPHDHRDLQDESADVDSQVVELARQVTRTRTRQSQYSGYDGEDVAKTTTRYSLNENALNPFTDLKENSSIDPGSENFNPRSWMKNLLTLKSRDPDRYPHRTAGLAFTNLGVHGFGTPTDYQKDVLNMALSIGSLFRYFTGTGKKKIQILKEFDGLVHDKEMLVVLGRPGSGCSTFLKTIAGEMNGIYLDKESQMNYQGISIKDMHSRFRGEAIYTAETDVHFPQLTVGETLEFAARARAPKNRLPDVSREDYARHLRDVVMAMYGLSHTMNTRVGNDFVRGVSGGERKRVSIAEATLSHAPLQCWDNSTRGLDSANAVEFCKTLRLMCDYMGSTACVAIYQAPQSAYDVFDKVVLLYEGRQIYFGRTNEARKFFVDMGFECPDRQTTADFLTSLTSPKERIVRSGFEGKTPNTPDEFAKAWKSSPEYAQLMKEIDQYNYQYPIGGPSFETFAKSKHAMQSKNQRAKSPFTLSVGQQISLCTRRGFQRLRGDASIQLSGLIGNFIVSIILGSIFFNLPDDTSSFYGRGALLFYAILLSAFASSLEILSLYAQRPIVEKHNRYALYHPFSEALSFVLCGTPYKLVNSFTYNLPLYFMTNLKRTPAAFFTYWLFGIVTTFAMSMFFCSIAAGSRTLEQALAPSAILILALVIFTGFVIPVRNMLGWSRWINYLNPVAYGFEAVMINEFDGRTFKCTQFIPSGPGYENAGLTHQICGTVGATSGASDVSGRAYLSQSYQYERPHLWRNLGILFAFLFGLGAIFLLFTEFISEQKSKGEVLLFRRGHQPTAKVRKESSSDDLERGATPTASEANAHSGEKQEANIQRQTSIFQWQDVCYDIKIKGNPRRILDHVDGWVKPGTCTALMGVSGAGKTTLLDVLATRVTMGVVTGDMLVDGRPRDQSFQRKTGYVQQQDLHLSTSTVKEALQFSAILRQSSKTPRSEKLAYVDEIIKLLEMESYADAVVGVPGEGLNVEQRKRLTIAVELVAKPQLLLFLDEPTSGLDSQTSWSILDLLDTLTAHGQAILCTIHQPSAMLFQRFDRLLFLAKGGKTVYFGDIGENASILSSYFERNGSAPCPPDANPAEWMLEVIGAAPGSHSEIDWPEVWNASPERAAVRNHLAEMQQTLSAKQPAEDTSDDSAYSEFAAPFSLQFRECLKRTFSQYYRTPSYIYAKFALCVISAIFIGFSFFKAKNSIQGLQNQMFSIFMLMTIFANFSQQLMPNFVIQRALYEARERPSKVYSWQAFMITNILVELPWNTLCAVLTYLSYYYPVGLYRNASAANALHERGALMFLFILAFLFLSSTMSHMIIAGIEVAATGGNLAVMLFSLCLLFCGVLVQKENLPGFWIFMYRVSPWTYLIHGMMATGLSGANVTCEDVELVSFPPVPGKTCYQYMEPYIQIAHGNLVGDQNSTQSCNFCRMSKTDDFLNSLDSPFSEAWRDFGFMWIYVVFNIFAALAIYWLVRVPKGGGVKANKDEAKPAVDDKEKKPAEKSEV